MSVYDKERYLHDLALGDGHGNDDRPDVGFGPDLVAVPMSADAEALGKAKFFLGRILGALENEGEVSHALWLEADNFLRDESRRGLSPETERLGDD